MEQRGWWHDAACNGADPELFFDPEREKEAKEYCSTCIVRKQCFICEPDKFGVFGGTNGRERERMHTVLNLPR